MQEMRAFTKSYNTDKYTKAYKRRSCKVMQAYKASELFQTMAIVSLNMGNLNLEVSNLKNRLAIREKEKAVL